MLFFLLINYVICHEWPYLPVISYYNIAFLLEVQIHNSQLYLIIDTGSSVTMIEKHYQNSETFQSLNSIYEQQYDLGKCNGVFGVDELILSKQVQIPQFTMAYGTCQQMPFFDENIGLMGMSNRHQVKHVFEDGQFSSSIFGLEFRRDGESRLYYNISTVQKVTWHKLSVDHRWMVNMLGVYANDEDVSDIFTGQAFIDSGYSCLILSHTQFIYLWEKYFKERCKLIDSQIYCDCQYSEFPNLTIYFEGAKITINSENYFPYSYNGKLCKLCLSKHKKDYLILGLPFVMSTTVLFDKRNQQIGLVDSPEIYQLSPWYFNIGLLCGGLIALWILFYSLQKDKTFIRIDIEMKNLEIL